MVKTIVVKMMVLFALAAMAGPSFAHHSASAFDLTKPVVLKGAVVTEFRWINPHPLIKADFTNEQGEVQHWTMEMGSTVSAQLVGWTRTALQPGDVVTLYVWAAKSGAHVGRFNKVEFDDGTVLRDSQRGADDGGRADYGVRQ
jgi:ABC-type glycerol-3-phosphate transport system substrate-binding protein